MQGKRASDGRCGSLFPLRALCVFWLLNIGTAVAAVPCSVDVTQPWLTLTVTAGAAVAASDRDLTVRVDQSGCVLLHRPSFLRDAGDFALQLNPAELTQLRQHIDPGQLSRFVTTEVQQQIRAAHTGRAASSAPQQRFAVLDADRYQLELHTGSQRSSVDWHAVHEYAEFYPEVAPLQELSRMVGALQELSARSDAQRVTGAAP